VKFLDEFRDPQLVEHLLEQIRRAADAPVTFMEVCGTHTMAIHRSGLRTVLPEQIRLISGPGCPVCVTPNRVFDTAIAYARLPDVTLATYGDMVRVPGSSTTLEAVGGDVRVVYSVDQAVQLAAEDPRRRLVFLGVGFETTAPACANAVATAQAKGIDNFYVLSAHKRIVPAMLALAADDLKLDGFLCPGHVSAVIGSRPYAPVCQQAHVPCVVAGFEPADILMAILMLLRQCRDGRAEVQIQYRRVVRPEGNPRAQAVMDRVFAPCDSQWRGLGGIPLSGMAVREASAAHDAERRIQADVEPTREAAGCICGQILKGTRQPADCPLFADACTPETPVGPCMVSSEGTCAAHYAYEAIPGHPRRPKVGRAGRWQGRGGKRFNGENR
jgi:hydrogenase expression/formation protein HypD